MLEKDGEDQLDRSCEKKNEILHIGKEKMNTIHKIKKKEG